MMGCSKKKTRSDAIKLLATGIEAEFSQWVKDNLLDKGHLIESYAKPLAEKIIGKKLYSITATSDDEYLLASYDGLSADDEDSWECKSWNELKAADVRAGVIPSEDVWQVVQQLAIGAKRCLYMVTDGTEEKTVYCWLHREDADIDRLVAGWNQMDADVAAYVPSEIKEMPKADTILDLPALSVQATGMVTYSNLPEFKASAEAYIAAINTDLVTDQHFADAEATVKFCKTTEDTLEITKKAILAQTSTIDEVIRTVDHIQAQLRDKRLMLDKLVKSEKEARKLAIVSKAGNDFAEHIITLESETRPIRLNATSPNFGEAVKGLKSLSSMQEKIDTVLRDGKFAADQTAKDIRAKLAWYKEHAAGKHALFPDLQQIIIKPMEDFTLLITSRVANAKAEEDARLEAERNRMEAEATAKAEREASAKISQEEARIRADERAKTEAQAKIERDASEKFNAEQEAIAEQTRKDEAAKHVTQHDQVAEAEAKERTNIEEEQSATAMKCDGNHGGPRCGDPECWNTDDTALVAKPGNVVVIEHQEEISSFLHARDFGKDANRIRAILVEFVKHQEARKMKAECKLNVKLGANFGEDNGNIAKNRNKNI